MQFFYPVPLLSLAEVNGILRPQFLHLVGRHGLLDALAQVVAIQQIRSTHLTGVPGAKRRHFHRLEPLPPAKVDSHMLRILSTDRHLGEHIVPAVLPVLIHDPQALIVHALQKLTVVASYQGLQLRVQPGDPAYIEDCNGRFADAGRQGDGQQIQLIVLQPLERLRYRIQLFPPRLVEPLARLPILLYIPAITVEIIRRCHEQQSPVQPLSPRIPGLQLLRQPPPYLPAVLQRLFYIFGIFLLRHQQPAGIHHLRRVLLYQMHTKRVRILPRLDIVHPYQPLNQLLVSLRHAHSHSRNYFVTNVSVSCLRQKIKTFLKSSRKAAKTYKSDHLINYSLGHGTDGTRFPFYIIRKSHFCTKYNFPHVITSFSCPIVPFDQIYSLLNSV